MLSRQLWQYFRGVPLPIQWKFIMCFLSHLRHMHPTFDLSQSTTTSISSSGFFIVSSCFLYAFRLPDAIFKKPFEDEMIINETGAPKPRRIARVLQLSLGSGWGLSCLKAGRRTAQPSCNRSHPLPQITVSCDLIFNLRSHTILVMSWFSVNWRIPIFF